MKSNKSALALLITTALSGCGAEDNASLDSNPSTKPFVSGLATPQLYAGMPVSGFGDIIDNNTPAREPSEQHSIFVWKTSQGEVIGDSREIVPNFEHYDNHQSLIFCMNPAVLDNGQPVLGYPEPKCGEAIVVKAPINDVPQVTEVLVTAVDSEGNDITNPAVGHTLVAAPIYDDSVEADRNKTLYTWYTSDQNRVDSTPIEGENQRELQLEKVTEGKWVHNCTTPVTSIGQQGRVVCSEPIGPIAADPDNSAPFVEYDEISVPSKVVVGATIEGAYLYHDAENDPQYNSIVEWFVEGNPDSVANALLSGESQQFAYQVQASDLGKALEFCVTPKAAFGNNDSVTVCKETSAVMENDEPTPEILAISITEDNASVGDTITGQHTLKNDQPEGDSYVEWRIGDAVTKSCTLYQVGCTDLVLTDAHLSLDHSVEYCVKPVTENGKPATHFTCSDNGMFVSGIKLSGELEYKQTITATLFGELLTSEQPKTWKVNTSSIGVSQPDELRNTVQDGGLTYRIGTDHGVETDHDWYAKYEQETDNDARYYVGKELEFCVGSDCVLASKQAGITGGLHLAENQRAIEPVTVITMEAGKYYPEDSAVVHYHRPLTNYEYEQLIGQASNAPVSNINGINWQHTNLSEVGMENGISESVKVCRALNTQEKEWWVPANYFGSGYLKNALTGNSIGANEDGEETINTQNTNLLSLATFVFGSNEDPDKFDVYNASPVFGVPFDTVASASLRSDGSGEYHGIKFQSKWKNGKPSTTVVTPDGSKTKTSLIMCAAQ